MWSSRLFWKTFSVYTVLTIAAAAAFTSVIAVRTKQSAEEAATRRLSDLVLVLQKDAREGLVGPRTERWQNWVRSVGEQHRVRVTIVAEDGTVVGDSRYDPVVLANEGSEEEVRRARDDGLGTARRTDSRSGESMIYVATRVGPPVRPAGFVRAGIPTAAVDAEVAGVQRWIWVTAAVLSLFGLMFTYLVLRRIVVPIQRLTRAARSMTSGDVEQNVVVESGDELQTLAESFNSTSRELSERIQLLRRKSFDMEAESERLETVLGAMIEGVVAIDGDERIIFANAAARVMLGRGDSNLVGRPIWEAVWHSEVQDLVRRALGRDDGGATNEVSPAENAVAEIELSQPTKRIAVVTRRLPGEGVPGVVLVMHDVTELRRLENMRTEFVQNVSHELKTPLALIRMNADTLLDWALEDPEENRQMLHNIEEQCDQLNNLIQDLLHLARIDSTRDAFELHPVDLDEVLESCVEELAGMSRTREIDLATEPAPARVTVLAHESGLTTVFKNLLANALHYTPEGGRVVARWRTDGDVAVVEVADTGIGIAPEDQQRIFERFFRVDKARSQDAGGTGLGLSIVKHLVQQFDGSVGVQSELGRGTTFTIRIPLA